MFNCHRYERQTGCVVMSTLAEVCCVCVGQLGVSELDGGANPKLWCALSDGKVLVFDAASWSMQQNSVQVGTSRLVRLYDLDG